MFSNLINWFKSFIQEFNSLSKKMKIAIIILCVLSLWLLCSAYLGFVNSPGEQYYERMYARANLHFPRYVQFIKLADRPTLEKVYGTVTSDIEWFKLCMILEVNAWKIYIDEQYKISNKE